MHASPQSWPLTPTSRRRIQAEREYDLAEHNYNRRQRRFRDTPLGKRMRLAKERRR